MNYYHFILVLLLGNVVLFSCIRNRQKEREESQRIVPSFDSMDIIYYKDDRRNVLVEDQVDVHEFLEIACRDTNYKKIIISDNEILSYIVSLLPKPSEVRDTVRIQSSFFDYNQERIEYYWKSHYIEPLIAIVLRNENRQDTLALSNKGYLQFNDTVYLDSVIFKTIALLIRQNDSSISEDDNRFVYSSH